MTIIHVSFPFTNDKQGLIQIGLIYENIVENNRDSLYKMKKKSPAFSDITLGLTLITRLNINHTCI